jgi:hypothetical protein
MHTRAIPQPESERNHALCRRLGQQIEKSSARFALCASLFASPFFVAGAAVATQAPQTPAPAPARGPASAQKNAALQPAATPSPATAPAQPPPPNWPANDLPAPASVVWDSHGLSITASNSSLAQILNDASTAIGAKIEGMGQDQRVFGSYGPGPARDVLSQLLDGSGYNVLLIGDQGQGTPRRIVLSERSATEGQTAQNKSHSTPADEDTDADQQADQPPEPPQPEPQPPQTQNGAAPAVPVRSQQQIIQEMQQRQQQMQQQQSQPPQNPQN